MGKEEVRLYNLMRCDKTTLVKFGDDFSLRIENHCFKTQYLNHIPIHITEEEFYQLKEDKKTYINKKHTPIIHKVRTQAVNYLKKNLKPL